MRHVVEDLGELAPLMQILDLPAPQTVDYVADALRFLDFPIAEQVIEVPTISCSPCPSRSPIPVPQLAEQLVEVPTVLSPTRIALRIVEQIVDTPVPRGRGQGSHPGQSTTATSSSLERIAERTVEQIVDIFSPGGGLGRGSASSAGAADEDFTVFFALFPMEKSAECRAGGECEAGWARQLTSAHQMARAGKPVDSDGSIVWVRMHDGDTDQSYYWNRRTSETTWRAPVGVKVVWVGEMSVGKVLWNWNQITRLTAHDGLPSDGRRGEGLGIPSPLLGCHSSCLKQEWFWRVRFSSWCLSSKATWSVVGFFWLLGERGAGEFWSAVRGCDMGRD